MTRKLGSRSPPKNNEIIITIITYSIIIISSNNNNNNNIKAVNVRLKVTMRRVYVTIVGMEKH